MKISELRSMYLKFFKEQGHSVIASASLIPEDDPSVLFTSAGMHPLVPYLLGQKHPEGIRLTNVQKCIRTTDIEDVGDTTHLTFFEMLGNWSLGDYWKKEAITWSYEFLTSKKWLGFDPNKLSITIFAGDEDSPRDDEAAEVWKSVGIPDERIYFLGKEDNWWIAGNSGPCGPCSEMFIEVDEMPKCGPDCRPGCSCGHYVEVWNDVFISFFRKSDGVYEPLEMKSIDTGMGVERTAAMLQGVSSVFETEVFTPLIERISDLSRKPSFNEEDTKLVRIIADHVRSAVMIMADDRRIGPSNVEQGYIVRRLLRKAIHSADRLGIGQGLLTELAKIVIDMFKGLYKEVERNKEFILNNIVSEEAKFRKTLKKALRRFDKTLEDSGSVTGRDAFLLFTSFGLPLEMTRGLAEEKGIILDIEVFKKEFDDHRQKSKTATEGKFKGGLGDHSEKITKLHTATHLLQAALRSVLGSNVTQNGSNITDERLRFDFTFSRKLTPDEAEKVEKLVNNVIHQDIEVTQQFMDYNEAINQGALAFFKENYGEVVSVYSVGKFSLELCGGPHVETTGVLGKFKIAKQKKIGAGIVRIRAVLETNS